MCSPPDEYRDPGTPRAAREQEDRIRTGDGAELRLFLAEPSHGLKRGAVLIIHDIWGYTDFYKDLARRIAGEGYAAALVDLFAREGDLPAGVQPPTRTPTAEDRARLGPAMARGERVTDQQAMGDLQVAVDDLKRRGAPRVVAWGFCSGGRLAYVAAARLSGLSGAVSYYGFLRAEPPRAAPLDLSSDIRVPLLGIFAGADQGIPAEQVAEFQRRLESAGKDFAIKTYPGAPHGFLRYGAADHADAISDALKRTFAFLARTFAT